MSWANKKKKIKLLGKNVAKYSDSVLSKNIYILVQQSNPPTGSQTS